MANKPIGAYATEKPDEWVAYDAEGKTWGVDEETAAQLEADRDNRNQNAEKART